MSIGPDDPAAWRHKVTFAHLTEPPFCFRRDDGTVGGCDVDVARSVLQAIGVRSVEPVLVEFSELLPGLVDGLWTMTTGLFVTPERGRLVAFSRPIWALPDGILVPAGNPKRVTGYADLAADPTARLAVVRDQVQHDSARRAAVPDGRIDVYGSQDEAAQAVRSGAVDAYASVAMAHRGYLRHAADPALAVVEVSPDAEDSPPPFGAFAFGPLHVDLRDRVDQALQAYLGTPSHRRLMAGYGFTDDQIDLVLSAR